MRTTWIADNQCYHTNRYIGELYSLQVDLPLRVKGQSVTSEFLKCLPQMMLLQVTTLTFCHLFHLHIIKYKNIFSAYYPLTEITIFKSSEFHV